MTQAPPSPPASPPPPPPPPPGGNPAETPNAKREFGGWRDRGWHTSTTRAPGAAPHDLVILRIPLRGLDDDRTTREARLAIARLRIVRASLSLEQNELVVRCPPGEPPVDAVARALQPLGVTLDTEHARTLDARFTPLTISAARPHPAARPWHALAAGARFLRGHVELTLVLIGGVCLVAGFGVHLLEGPLWLRLTLLGASAILTSTSTFPEALQSLRERRVNIDVLMFAAAAGAALLGHYEEGAFLLFLFGLGSAGEHLALSRARSAIDALASIAPDTALVLDDAGATTEVPVDDVAIGARVLVRPFDRVPLDAEIIDGRTALDESTITGESIPVDKGPGDPVFAGTMNTDAAIRIRVTKPASQSTLARVLELVAEAQEGRSGAQLFTDRIERWYVPFVFIATAAVFLASALLVDALTWKHAFYNSMAFMTAASPCALAIGTPAAVLCAVARAARLGVLFKGGAHLDTLAQTRAIAYDKTGTLTRGRPEVTDVITGDQTALRSDDVLALAASVESQVTHPLADAIAAHAGARGLSLPPASDATQIAGAGARATVNGSVISVLKPSSVPIERWPASLSAAAGPMADQGRTLVLVTRDDAPIGLIALADTIRPEAPSVVDRLRRLGIARQVMLTGDNAVTARHIAEVTHLDETHAELLPEQKLERIRAMLDEHGTVAMVGDGVNDAPALAAASIGIAMGAAGADVAMETADVALMGASLENLPRAIELSRAARRIIRQNVVIALAVITIVAPLGAIGLANLGMAVLLHEGSTIIVVLNALRLLRQGRS